MKALLGDHWEKLVLVLAVLVAAASALFNLVLRDEKPPLVAASETAFAELEALRTGTPASVFLELTTFSGIEKALVASAPAFPVTPGLINYTTRSGASVKHFMTLGDPPLEIDTRVPFTRFQVSPLTYVAVTRPAPSGTKLLLEALQEGSADIALYTNDLLAKTVQVTVKPRSRIELGPPQLLGAQPNPQEPGEILLNWRDDPRTASKAVLGYVVERRELPGGSFQNILGTHLMLPAGTQSHTDVVDPSRRYEYRITTIGGRQVTDILP